MIQCDYDLGFTNNSHEEQGWQLQNITEKLNFF